MNGIANNLIPEGYKHTEVGIIPNDWKVRPIGEITKISIGRDLMINRFSNIPDDKYKYPVFSNTVSNYGLYGYYDFPEYFGEGLTIVGRGVGLGTAFQRSGGFGAIGRLIVLFPESKIDPGYLSNYINNRVKIHSESGGIPQLTGISLAKYRVPLPPNLAEQTAIATTLSDMDSLISSLEKLIAKKRLIKQGAMQQLLGLAGASQRKPKEGWVKRKLGEVGTIITGGTPPTINSENWNGDIPWVTPTDIDNNQRDIYFTGRQITPSGLKTIRIIPAESLLVTCIASIGKNVILKRIGACNQQINAIVPFENYDVNYLYYLMELSKSFILSKAGITATPIISKKEFGEFEFLFPLLRKQQVEIATILSEMDDEINSIEKKLKKNLDIKNAMMQNLLTGKIRLV